ncbi:hypothetical protein ACSYAY_07345 [Leptospirillum ferriphilum]|uniref:hypothetical protein n=1 Tax=Leptospirillum ferriphilum TaxID=178606 RepID=UPI000984BE39|nr:hypothetical protein [Leptospirillum ferriphilum]OOH82470.1 hypothetical protein BOX30_03185 [Leptospirillum ferriphilum]
MTNHSTTPVFDETSPSIQAHLEILQSIIQRMATNSTSCKTWCITIMSAILVIIADKGKPDLALIALFPAIFFAGLDAYYLALEIGFRNSYNEFIRKLHTGHLTTEDLYSVAPIGRSIDLQIAAIKSFSVWGFYLPLVILVAFTRKIVIK